MPTAHLETYLNDHLAGAVAALEMLDRLADHHADLVDAEVVRELRRDIDADKATLEALMSAVGVTRSRPRRFMGWLAERATRLKLASDDPNDGALRAFETVELISLGIEGKAMLWQTLSVIATRDAGLATVDYAALISRARAQRVRLQPIHDSTALAALL